MTIESYWRKSYAQLGEDILIVEFFDSIGISRPSYIDVGAFHPFKFSNTALLYENGSRGINIEPNDDHFPDFLKHRSEDVNLNIGVSDVDNYMDFLVFSDPLLCTFSLEQAEWISSVTSSVPIKKRKVRVENLGSIIHKYKGGQFPEFLNLDVEGMEERILSSLDFDQSSPIMICLETRRYFSKERNDQLVAFLLSRGYTIVADSYVNTIFVRYGYW